MYQFINTIKETLKATFSNPNGKTSDQQSVDVTTNTGNIDSIGKQKFKQEFNKINNLWYSNQNNDKYEAIKNLKNLIANSTDISTKDHYKQILIQWLINKHKFSDALETIKSLADRGNKISNEQQENMLLNYKHMINKNSPPPKTHVPLNKVQYEQALYDYAYTYYRHGKHQLAINFINRIDTKALSDSIVYLKLTSLLTLGQISWKTIEKAELLTKKTNQFTYCLLAGNMYFAIQKPQKALEYYNSAVSTIQGAHLALEAYLALIKLSLTNPKVTGKTHNFYLNNAKKIIATIKNLQPSAPDDFYFKYAKHLIDAKKTSEGLCSLAEHTCDNNNIINNSNLGLLYRDMYLLENKKLHGNMSNDCKLFLNSAIKHYKKAIELYENQTSRYYIYTMIDVYTSLYFLNKLANNTQTKDYLDRAEKLLKYLEDKDFLSHKTCSENFNMLKSRFESDELIDKFAAKISENIYKKTFKQAQTNWDNKKHENAIKSLKKLLEEIAPNNSQEYKKQLIEWQMQTGKYKDAIKTIQETSIGRDYKILTKYVNTLFIIQHYQNDFINEVNLKFVNNALQLALKLLEQTCYTAEMTPVIIKLYSLIRDFDAADEYHKTLLSLYKLNNNLCSKPNPLPLPKLAKLAATLTLEKIKSQNYIESLKLAEQEISNDKFNVFINNFTMAQIFKKIYFTTTKTEYLKKAIDYFLTTKKQLKDAHPYQIVVTYKTLSHLYKLYNNNNKATEYEIKLSEYSLMLLTNKNPLRHCCHIIENKLTETFKINAPVQQQPQSKSTNCNSLPDPYINNGNFYIFKKVEQTDNKIIEPQPNPEFNLSNTYKPPEFLL